jgi:hypothetical protein
MGGAGFDGGFAFGGEAATPVLLFSSAKTEMPDTAKINTDVTTQSRVILFIAAPMIAVFAF